MTARTSQLLADALRAAGLVQLAERAEADEFHDFLSQHDFPEITLANELAAIGREDWRSSRYRESTRIAALNIRQRLIEGEFDADAEESEAWARSEEGQEIFRELSKDLRTKR